MGGHRCFLVSGVDMKWTKGKDSKGQENSRSQAQGVCVQESVCEAGG